MTALEKLDSHLRGRPTELAKARREGKKIIAYTPGGFLPEELLYACGATPVSVGLVRGGEHEPVMMSGAYLPRWLDTFSRAQIGYRVLKEETLYDMVDLLVSPITDNDIRSIADCFDFYTDVPVFRFGVPHKKSDHGYKYYLDGVNRLKARLEEVTGVKITDEKLREGIDLYNKMRGLLKELSLMRQAARPPLSIRDFTTLNHATFVGDVEVVTGIIEEFRNEVKGREGPAIGPRILLTGSTLAYGDSRMFDLVERAGAAVVIEEFAEGIRHYWETVKPDKDLMAALADRYYTRRIPPGYFRPARERLDFLVKLTKDFKVDGVIWYQMMYRSAYDFESYYFPDILKKETGLSMLKIETDYDTSELGPFRTRVETFIETIKK